MRTPFVAGNWKMNKTIEQARTLVTAMLPAINGYTNVERVLCPPFTALPALAGLLKGSSVGLGAQNMHWEASGAFTGEIAPAMVKELCNYVILGHSERRAYFGETNGTVNKKTKAALEIGLIPIVCVGETLAEFEAGQTAQVVGSQIAEGLAGFTAEQAAKIVIAYEPVWAIGTGKAATAEDANNVVGKMIRPAVEKLYGKAISAGTRVLYGGSVNGANAASFFGMSEIDGALVGGACLKVDDFTAIIQAAAR
jgi:triosephosphate isomerase (TIM)